MLVNVSEESFFSEVKEYVGFTDEDSERLQAFLPLAEPHFPRISTRFYDAILRHPSAHAAITGGEEQVERLKGTLRSWMASGLAGPHDDAFYQKRCRIGRVHVQIRLPQQYMFTAMNLMRLDFRDVAMETAGGKLEEIIPLTKSLDRLFDIELAIMLHTYREDSESRLRASERLATIGQLAASIGHDLRNPLGVIESSLFILRKRIKDEPRAERHLTKISAQVENCNHIVTDLLELARDRPPKFSRVPVERAFSEAREGLPVPPDVTIDVEAPAGLAVRADPGLLRQILVNLISNSIIAFEGKPGTVFLGAEDRQNGRVRITVGDDGPGFDVDTLPRVFEPLFTTRAKGTGLGLAMVKNVMDRHGGLVQAANRKEGGALIALELDIATED